MNVVDIIIIILLISYALKGFKDGAIKEIVSFVGVFAILVIAYILKNPLSVYMYQNFPFFNFHGILSGISVLNIVVYEAIAFLGVAGILLIIYKVLIAATNIVETILKVTIILEIPSKIIGFLVGLIEGITITFFILFIGIQFDETREYIDASKFGNTILTETPVLSNTTNKIYASIDEIYTLANEYKESDNKNEVNLKALEVLLKYKVIDAHNAQVLVDTGKLTMYGATELIDKYY